MAEHLVEHICTPMTLVALYQLLYISMGVRLAFLVRTAIGTAPASKLAHTARRQKILKPRKAGNNVRMQMCCNPIIGRTPELLLCLAPRVLYSDSRQLRMALNTHDFKFSSSQLGECLRWGRKSRLTIVNGNSVRMP